MEPCSSQTFTWTSFLPKLPSFLPSFLLLHHAEKEGGEHTNLTYPKTFLVASAEEEEDKENPKFRQTKKTRACFCPHIYKVNDSRIPPCCYRQASPLTRYPHTLPKPYHTSFPQLSHPKPRNPPFLLSYSSFSRKNKQTKRGLPTYLRKRTQRLRFSLQKESELTH